MKEYWKPYNNPLQMLLNSEKEYQKHIDDFRNIIVKQKKPSYRNWYDALCEKKAFIGGFDNFGDCHRDISKISITNLISLAEYFNVSTDYLLGLNDCRSVCNAHIQEQTGLTDNAIERLKGWNYDHYGYKPYEEYTRPLNMVLESIQAKNIMKAVLQYLDADMAIIKKVTAYDIGEDRPIEINDLDPARTTFDYEYPDGSSITSTVINPSLLRTDALNQVKECLDIMRKDLKERGDAYDLTESGNY